MKKTLLILLSAFLFFSCNKNVIYSEYNDISSWSKDSVFTFNFEISDTISSYELDFLVRNTEDFPRQNLWLQIEKENNGTIFVDTVSVYFIDDYGRWRGKGIGSYYDNNFIYKQNVKFYSSGKYTYKIRHLMRTDNLVGIKKFGFQICKEK
ncbi:MAG: gliding motility lipoprotein GldH [Prevotellaceae bacterium]|jgi:gliding motility-associated lipoprotein GldH|nr:gliding motility lipoprotein GldH [Prevotellaceae bacterium]